MLPLWVDSTVSEDERDRLQERVASVKRSMNELASTPAPSPAKKRANAGKKRGLPSPTPTVPITPTISSASSLSTSSAEVLPTRRTRQAARMSTGGKPSAQWLAQQAHEVSVTETRARLAHEAATRAALHTPPVSIPSAARTRSRTTAVDSGPRMESTPSRTRSTTAAVHADSVSETSHPRSCARKATAASTSTSARLLYNDERATFYKSS